MPRLLLDGNPQPTVAGAGFVVRYLLSERCALAFCVCVLNKLARAVAVILFQALLNVLRILFIRVLNDFHDISSAYWLGEAR